ncbi:hypothetical protein E2C01_025494 [Portunus trituberculatus]|uniref:Uncharacterized protein n=1 Tax=Portunus trituberculatus TaxID=210409 RepID=A0A5B7EFE1_PORTR|nr:hypothetical protein [Portunus trituberculatus]
MRIKDGGDGGKGDDQGGGTILHEEGKGELGSVTREGKEEAVMVEKREKEREVEDERGMEDGDEVEVEKAEAEGRERGEHSKLKMLS